MNSFEKYLLCIPREDAVDHVVQCLLSGYRGELAWDLMKRFNGDWTVDPGDLQALISKTIDELSREENEIKTQ